MDTAELSVLTFLPNGEGSEGNYAVLLPRFVPTDQPVKLGEPNYCGKVIQFRSTATLVLGEVRGPLGRRLMCSPGALMEVPWSRRDSSLPVSGPLHIYYIVDEYGSHSVSVFELSCTVSSSFSSSAIKKAVSDLFGVENTLVSCFQVEGSASSFNALGGGLDDFFW